MSNFNDINITCEPCGEEFRGTVWTAVNAKQDPELKDILLGGELNMVMCPKCSHVGYQEHFVLYQDPAEELVAYVYPAAQQGEAEVLKVVMLQGFREAQEVYDPKDRLTYEPVLMFGLASLVDMLKTEENRAAQSQIAAEICKGHQIFYHVLRPSEARKRGLMRVIPYQPGESNRSRASVLKGLQEMLKFNPLLNLYQDLKKQVESNPQWRL